MSNPSCFDLRAICRHFKDTKVNWTLSLQPTLWLVLVTITSICRPWRESCSSEYAHTSKIKFKINIMSFGIKYYCLDIYFKFDFIPSKLIIQSQKDSLDFSLGSKFPDFSHCFLSWARPILICITNLSSVLSYSLSTWL